MSSTRGTSVRNALRQLMQLSHKLHIRVPLRLGSTVICDSRHKYHFFMRRKIFTVIFTRCKCPSYRRISPENYPYYGENTLSKKKLQLRENYESYARILQSVPIILKHT